MATGPEHFRAAEELIAGVEAHGADFTPEGRADQVAIAQVHATLAIGAPPAPHAVTFDLSDPAAAHVLKQALGDFAAASRAGDPPSARWADLADLMLGQAEAAG